jgi:hypothetical protein
MDRALDVRMFAEYPSEKLPVGDVAFVEGPIPRQGSVSDDQRIEDDSLVASVFQSGANRAADVSGPTGNQDFHVSTPGV